MRESTIENYLVHEVRKRGGRALKFVSPGHAGVPDRLVIAPGGRIVFAELKAPGRKPTPLQLAKQNQLKTLGCTVYACIDSKEAVDAMLEEVMPQ